VLFFVIYSGKIMTIARPTHLIIALIAAVWAGNHFKLPPV